MASHGIARVASASVPSAEARQKELEQITVYKNIVDMVNKKAAERQYTTEVLDLITKLLNKNPEYYTIWNHRRRVLGALLDASPTGGLPSSHRGSEALVDGELHLTQILLRQYPKCYWIWNHRNWVLRQGESMSDTEAARKLWSGELQLVGKMLHVDSRNFHAWSYRRDVVAHLERILTSISLSTSTNLPGSLAESEYEYTTKMIKTNLSNFSAWHNRAKLIPRLLNERGADNAARKELFESELALICTAINTDPFDQSIWYYHQYLMSTLSPECPKQQQVVLGLSNMDRQRYYAHEMEYIQEIAEDEADCKWIYVALLHLAASYLETDGGTNAFKTVEMRGWLEQLSRLDPLRKGRWEELGGHLNV